MATLLTLNPVEGFNQCECNGLDDYYKELDCDIFDIATRKIGDRYYDIFCDDVGLFRENPKPSAVSEDGKVMLVGNLIFANHDGQGNTTSLSSEDVIRIVSNSIQVEDKEGNRYTVVMCDY